MALCFVIQPFDENGPFDKRYRDVLAPAIKKADLEPYRVDEDPSTAVPIDDIEKGIRDSEICLADITPDNPNIWYEVGYAFAHGKPVVMICAKPRPTKAPFDVHHRTIISYTLDSPSDFEQLGKQITARLKAQVKKSEAMQSLSSLSPVIPTEGLTSYEVAGLVSAMENGGPGTPVTPREIRNDMRKAGYTELAVSMSLESLRRKRMIEFVESDPNDFGQTWPICRVTAAGVDWLLANQERFRFTVEPKDEDIPF